MNANSAKRSRNKYSNARTSKSNESNKSSSRYAVVGLGYIAQVAILPAFKNAKQNSLLTALVSHDPEKLSKLSKKYKVPLTASYHDYQNLLQSDDIDAVYIALPNSMHAEFTLRALENGKHVLCEKPLGVTVEECERMIEASQRTGAKLMTAYRLHFEEANLNAVEVIRGGRIGAPRILNSTFSFQIRDDNVRLQRAMGGGSVYDMGIYCLNAARYLFRDEPIEVFAMSVKNSEERFREVDEMTSVVMRFPHDRIATFTSSFGAADSSRVEVIGTKGSLRMEPAFDYSVPLKQEILINGKSFKKTFKKADQFAAELLYFSECILSNHDPEPSGWEGLADVRIIQAIYESAQTRRSIHLEEIRKDDRPSVEQQIKKPAIKEPNLFHADSPSN